MKTLVWGIALISLSFLTHLIIWRVRLPLRQTKTLLVLFFGILSIGLMTNYFLAQWLGEPQQWLFYSIPEYLQIVIFFTALTLGYIITYSALEADSPSLVIILSIHKSGKEGMSKQKFEQLMNNTILIDPRIADLERDQMVIFNHGKYQLTSKGRRFAQLFTVYRRMLRANVGG